MLYRRLETRCDLRGGGGRKRGKEEKRKAMSVSERRRGERGGEEEERVISNGTFCHFSLDLLLLLVLPLFPSPFFGLCLPLFLDPGFGGTEKERSMQALLLSFFFLYVVRAYMYALEICQLCPCHSHAFESTTKEKEEKEKNSFFLPSTTDRVSDKRTATMERKNRLHIRVVCSTLFFSDCAHM